MQSIDKLTLVELRSIIAKVLDNLEEEGYEDFNISHDHYWQIDSSQKYDPYKDPNELTIGQLKDDVKTMRSILSGKKEPLRSDLIGLAEILRYLGENPSLRSERN